MPKNTTGGSGHKKRKNSDAPLRKNLDDLKKNSEFDFFAKCTKPLGNRRFEVTYHNSDGQEMTLHCRLAGSCRKKIQKDTFVLVQLFPFNLKQGQIVNVFDNEDVGALKKAGLWDFKESEKNSDFFNTDDPFDILPDMTHDEHEHEQLAQAVQVQAQAQAPIRPIHIDDNVI